MKKQFIKFLVTFGVLGLIFTLFNSPVPKASTTSLSEEQKLEIYQEYQKIVDEINSNEPNSTLELHGFEKFPFEEYNSISEFREFAQARANTKLDIVEDTITPFSIGSTTKTKTVTSNDSDITVSIFGAFYTSLNSATNRQEFTGEISNISTTVSKGSWLDTASYDAKLSSDNRTYNITVHGKIVYGGLSSGHHIDVVYRCGATGSVY